MSSIREQFAGDRHRPVYHFVPPKNWTNDPTGTFQDGGLFHLFYQYRDAPSPEGPGGWGTWCHAATEDFIHWIDYPVALERDEGGPDRVGCWSGGAFERDGSHTLIYWGNPGGICLATSDDGYRTWRKHPRNPGDRAAGRTGRVEAPRPLRLAGRGVVLHGQRLPDRQAARHRHLA